MAELVISTTRALLHGILCGAKAWATCGGLLASATGCAKVCILDLNAQHVTIRSTVSSPGPCSRVSIDYIDPLILQ